MKSDDTIWRLAFTADDKLVACGGQGTSEYGFWRPEFVQCWDVSKGKVVSQGKGPAQAINFASLAPDGKNFFYGGHKSLSVWHATPPKLRHSVHQKDPGFLSFALSPDGLWIASASWGGIVQIWDAGTLKEKKRFTGAGYRVTALAFSPDGKILASAQKGSIRLWDTRTGKRLDPSQGQDKEIKCLTFAQHDERIISVAGESIEFWETATGGFVRRLRDEGTVGKLIALSPDERFLASADEGISLWSVASGRLIHRSRLLDSWVETLGFLDDGRLSSAGGTLKDAERGESWIALWDTKRHKEVRRLPLKPNRERYLATRAISPDGQVLVTSNSVMGSLPGPCPPVYFWNAAQGRRLRQLGGRDTNARLIIFSPDGRTLATAGWYEEPLQIWEVLTGNERRQLPRGKETITSMAFSPNGTLLATGNARGDIRLRDLASGKERGALVGHDREVSCLSFSANGMLLASGSQDTTILVWDVAVFAKGGPPAIRSPGEKLSALWEELGAANAGKAYRALWNLVDVPDETVALLRKSLRPVASVEVRVKELIADLGSDDFAVRTRAKRELKVLGELAWPALRELLEDKPELEVRRRAQQLLEEPILPPTPEQVRALRAIEALELLGTKEARQILETLASGARGARLTREAKASLHRLAHRSASRP